MTSPVPVPPQPIDALTDAINAIAAKVNLPLDLAADLLKAVDECATERASKAVAAERERCAQLAEQHGAHYGCYVGVQGSHVGVVMGGQRPFASLLRETRP